MSASLRTDIGGILTDLVLHEPSGHGSGSLKVLTTHADPGRGTLPGTRRLLSMCGVALEVTDDAAAVLVAERLRFPASAGPFAGGDGAPTHARRQQVLHRKTRITIRTPGDGYGAAASNRRPAP